MAENKMLIDATHPEETRVVVLREGRVEEFDYESAARKLLRGSIFLAKITRVEPSLQAAFVDYGGNRHGFLAFNEIHPDYYQIPHADRQALLEEQMARHMADQGDDFDAADSLDVDGGVTEHADDDEREGDDDGDAVEAAAEQDDLDDLNNQADADDESDLDNEADFDDGADPEIEAAAIDVTDYLPPEPAEVSKAEQPPAGNDQVELAANADQAEADNAEPESPEPAGSEEAPAQSSADETANEGKPSSGGKPKTIAAALPPDERIVSDTIVPVEGEQEASELSEAVAPGDGDSTIEISEPAAEGSESTDNEAADIERFEPAGDVAADSSDHGSGELVEAEPAMQDGAPASSEDQAPAADIPEARVQDDEALATEEVIAEDIVVEAEPLAEVPVRRRRRPRSYKIQEVIKRRQIVLVQVVKEERGNKGAALTTYLSLAGRYTVLMPNTARGGGISRKITNLQDRKRLKAIAQELDVPEGMGLIIRTAGAARTKQEIKRDFEYLLRLWENVRDLTLQSTAPSLVYEEGDLIKRSIRDLYSKDIDQVVVAGETAHKEAKSFMRMLMPSHAKNVIKYDDPQPLFARYRIEPQLNAMFSPVVQLRSGGYLVINQTEALVAVDVNSGKSTRKFSIEDTALNTNLEAAEELTRQLKLRDLAGLIVIDFIDMEEKRNNRAVERRLKECLRDDRARIQVGRISHFGLLEMSRQRLRTGVLEGSTMPCQHCQGTGTIRSIESVGLAILRTLEDTLMGGSPSSLTAQCSRDVAMYLLNAKRHFILDMETRYGVNIEVMASEEQHGAEFAVERAHGGAPLPRRVDRSAVNVDSGFTEEDDTDDTREASRDDVERRSRRRRRRRARRPDSDVQTEAESQSSPDASASDDEGEATAASPNEANGATEDGDERGSRRRRRGRRGGRRNRGERASAEGVAAPGAPQPDINGLESNGSEADAPEQSADATTPGNDDAGSEPMRGSADGMAATTNDIVEASEAGEVVRSSSDGEHDTAADAAPENDDRPAEQPTSTASQDADQPPPEEAPAGVEAAQDDDGGAEEAPAVQSRQPDAVETTALDDTPEATTPAADSVEVSEPAAISEAEVEVPVAKARRGEPVASAPVLERVVMTPDSADPSDDGAKADTQSPARKGWWQRRFGS